MLLWRGREHGDQGVHLRDFEEQVGRTETPEALWALCTTFFQGRRIARVTYHHLPPVGAPDGESVRFRSVGFPEDLVARYVADRMWRENPMLRHARSKSEPFYWSEVAQTVELSPNAKALFDDLVAAGLADGLGVEVFGPNGRNGYCGLGLAGEMLPLPVEAVRDLHWACQLAHLRYCSMLADEFGAPPVLSPRENEVLAWVARGKSNTVIGEILGISGHTVDAHLRRIFLKLEVGDRISATVRGLGVGLIHVTG